MKNSIKAIIILGIVTSFFSVYPMEVEPDYYSLDLSTLKGQDILSRNSFRADWRSKKPSIFCKRPVPLEHPIHKDRALALILTALKVFEETDRVENEKTLESVCDAVRDGIPVMSHFVYKKKRISYVNLLFCCNVNFFVYHSESPISIFTPLEDFFARQFTGPSELYGKWLGAVFQGHCKRQKEVCKTLIAYKSGDEFKIKIPSDIASSIFSYISEEVLIQEAKKKFDEEPRLLQNSRNSVQAFSLNNVIKTLNFGTQNFGNDLNTEERG